MHRVLPRSCTLDLLIVRVPFLNLPKVAGHQIYISFATKRTRLTAYSACAPGSVICYGSYTQWVWFRSAPMLRDLGRKGGAGKSERCCQSWPVHWPCLGPTFSPLFLSLSATPDVVFWNQEVFFYEMFFFFYLGCFFNIKPARYLYVIWLYLHEVTISFSIPLVCAMAVRNCLECQQAQFKYGTESSARNYTAIPNTALGTAKSASAQASYTNHLILASHTSPSVLFLQKYIFSNLSIGWICIFLCLCPILGSKPEEALPFVLLTNSIQVLLH